MLLRGVSWCSKISSDITRKGDTFVVLFWSFLHSSVALPCSNATVVDGVEPVGVPRATTLESESSPFNLSYMIQIWVSLRVCLGAS